MTRSISDSDDSDWITLDDDQSVKTLPSRVCSFLREVLALASRMLGKNVFHRVDVWKSMRTVSTTDKSCNFYKRQDHWYHSVFSVGIGRNHIEKTPAPLILLFEFSLFLLSVLECIHSPEENSSWKRIVQWKWPHYFYEEPPRLCWADQQYAFRRIFNSTQRNGYSCGANRW